MKTVLRGAVALFAMALVLASRPALAMDKAVPKINIQVQRSTLLDLASVGSSLIGVGERGVIARSDDGGKSWSSQLSPTSRTLTAVAFADDKVGVAVGHGGTILRTEDAGKTWAAVTFAEIGRDAVLGVTALRNGQIVAYGAFGMYLVSPDHGKTWRRDRVMGDDFDRHISRVIDTREAMFLVAETGVIGRSKDGGKDWVALKTPYEGSYFGILEMKDGALLAFGMRGNVYRSANQGEDWEKVPFASKATINGGSVASDGRVVLAGNRGLLAISSDAGRSFALMTAPEGTSIAQASLLANGEIAYVGSMASGRIDTNHIAKASALPATPAALQSGSHLSAAKAGR